MIRMILVAAAVLLCLGGVAFALSRPDIRDPGPPVSLDAGGGTGASGQPAAISSPRDADDGDDTRGDKGSGARLDRDAREDGFRVAAPKAVKAHGDDWDDDDWDDDDWNDDDDDDDD